MTNNLANSNLKEKVYIQSGTYEKNAKLTVALFAFYALKTAWLAFDKLQYSPLFYYVGEILVILCLPCAIVTIFEMRYIKITANKALIFLPLINWCLIIFHSYEENDIFRATYTLLVIYAFILFSSSLKKEIFNVMYQIILITSVISIMLYIFYIVGLNIGFSEVPYYNSSWSSYIKWFIFAIYKDKIELRLCGIFNEPGGLGTICALVFIARYKEMSKWEKAIFLIAILLSFSLAGFLIIFGFILINIAFKNKKYFLFIVPLIVAFLLIPNIDFGNEAVNKFIARMAVTSQGIAGDNRTKPAFDILFESFIHSEKLLFGYGAGYVEWTGVLSYKTYIVQYGILGFGFWLFMWIKAGLYQAKKNKDCLIFLLFFLISLYQRPALLESIYGYVLLFGGMEWLKGNDPISITKG